MFYQENEDRVKYFWRESHDRWSTRPRQSGEATEAHRQRVAVRQTPPPESYRSRCANLLSESQLF